MTTTNQAGSRKTKGLMIWLLVGLATGGAGGAIRAHATVSRNSKYLSQLMSVSEYENLALLQYKYGDTNHARQAMQDLLNFLDRVEASGLVVDKSVIEFDRSVTYTRLALLDEKSGDLQSSRKHIDAAVESSKKLGNTDPSESRLRQVAATLDSHLP